MSNRIFLVGLPGSGKTTLAPLLAARLGWAWVDLDREIETRTGQTIPELFTQSEAAFRQQETEALAAVAGRERCIIATGGGVVLAEANRQVMRQGGTTVALLVTPEFAVQRIAAQGITRPLLQPAPLHRMQQLVAERAALYAEADLMVETDGVAPEAIARRVLASVVAAGKLTNDTAPETIAVALPQTPYTITVGWGLFAQLADQLRGLGLPHRLTVVTDAQVAALLLPGVLAQLTAQGFIAQPIIIPAGEPSKSMTQLGAIYDALIAARAERGEALVALGGGVVGDLAGFAAATYLRGVPLIHVPTTLLAQVDSAIGGKTGINHPLAKNAIGAFYQPRAVLIDPAALLSLDDRLLREGWGEIVKYAITLDADLFGQLEAVGADLPSLPAEELTPIIARCARLKAQIVSEDEREAEQRMVLNYGHTIGHALEATTGYGTLLHGEAVFLGMAVEARIAERLGLISAEVVARQDALTAAIGPQTPTALPDALTILAATRLDKKTRGGRIQWVLPVSIGATTLRADVPDDLVLAVLGEWLARMR
jgi:3-dehydroquinate synthase